MVRSHPCSMRQNRKDGGNKTAPRLLAQVAVDADTLNRDWKYKRRNKLGGRGRAVRGTHEFVVEFEVIKRYVGRDV